MIEMQKKSDRPWFAGYNPKFAKAALSKQRESARIAAIELDRAKALEREGIRKLEEREAKLLAAIESERIKSEQEKNKSIIESCDSDYSIDVSFNNELTPFEAANLAVSKGFNSVKGAINLMAGIYGVSADDIVGEGRLKKIMTARHAAICAIKIKWPEASMPFIARFFNAHHTSILHALRKNGVIHGRK